MNRHNRSRKTDIDKLNAWIAVNPVQAWAAMLGKGLQPWTIERIISGKQIGAPRPSTRHTLCEITGMTEAVLFPFRQEEKKTA